MKHSVALLVTHRGRTTTVPLGIRPLVIGRSRDCDVVLDDPQVSRRHVTIHPEPLAIQDLGSHNGTQLLTTGSTTDDTQSCTPELRLVPNSITPLPADALIQIGSAAITVRSADHAANPTAYPGLVVIDPAMQRVLELADRVAAASLTVVLLGESGTGKDLLARYIHERSPRAKHRLISLNCGALPESLLESELFGHEKGAFTGAVGAKPGLLQAAHGGTLFLDEVAELPPAVQVKLLRVIEDRRVLPIGAVEPRIVDVRFLAATNRNLDQRVATGDFREDLFYRLYGVALHIPPLRERKTEIVPLAERFLADLGAGDAPVLTTAACEKLVDHNWPGNVRELKNVVHRAFVLRSRPEIGPDDIVLAEREARGSQPAIGDPDQLRKLAEAAERRQVLEAIEACTGNQTRAARLLGLTRRALIRRLEKFDLPRPRRVPRDS